ncbi:hypothetical protein HDU67_002132 [Dinochytrium kinnereticum]|nr:hypothetical protein HDU67_002132 [Dinochytrium kinnereticum]
MAARYGGETGRPTIYLRDTIAQGSTFGEDFMAVYPDRVDMGNRFLDAWRGLIGRDPSIMVGYEVVSVDGIDPVAYVQSYSDKYVGLSHTPETRFNYALASSKYFRGRLEVQDGPFFSTSLFPSDLATTRTYVLRPPPSSPDQSIVTIEVPWMAFLAVKSSRPINSQRYHAALCRAPEIPTTVVSGAKASFSKTAAMKSKSRVYRGRLHNAVDLATFLYQYAHMLDSIDRGSKTGSKAAVKTAPPSQPIVSDLGAAFYMLRGNKTAVFALPGFEPGLTPDQDLTEDSLVSWMSTVAKGLKSVQDAGAENLVMDLSGNGGGVICMGKTVLRHMFPTSQFVQYDVRMSDENSYLLGNANTFADDQNAFILDGQVVPSGYNSSANAGRVVVERASDVRRALNATTALTERVSGRFGIDCFAFETIMRRFTRLPRPFEPSRVAVLSNGFCGSTCGESVRSLRRQFGVKTFVYGGGGGQRPFQPTAFEGGSVLQYSQMLIASDGIVRSTRTAPDSPEQPPTDPTSTLLLPLAFPQPVIGQVLHWQSYTDFISPTNGSSPTKTSTGIPDEWWTDPADYYLPVEDPTDIVKAWMGVAASLGDAVGGAGARGGIGGGGSVEPTTSIPVVATAATVSYVAPSSSSIAMASGGMRKMVSHSLVIAMMGAMGLVQ